MGAIVDKIKLDEKYDRRVKLLQEDKKEIKRLYATGNFSLNDLAKIYNVSKKAIHLTVNENVKKKDEEYKKNNWKKFQQSKEIRTRNASNTRNYKRELLEKGLISDKKW